jgi:hypothetical protein
MKVSKIYKYILIALSVVFGFSFLSIIIYFFYPNPINFWKVWHKKDINYVTNLGINLGLANELDTTIRCWDATNSKCGIVFVFTTNLELENLKANIDALNYKQKLSREIDGYGIQSTIGLNTSRKLEINGISDLLAQRDTMSRPYGWGWSLINNKGRRLNVSFFKPNLIDHYQVDDKELKENIVEIIYYTRGR